MPQYWVIAPFAAKNPELYDAVWRYDLANSVISIGWAEVGDFSALTRDTLMDRVALAYPNDPPATKSLVSNMLWAFYHEIQPGDVILARRGRKVLAGVGRVTGKASYSPGRNPSVATPDNNHPNFLEVAWFDTPRDKSYPDLVFPMHTVWRIDEASYNGLVGAAPPLRQAPDASEGVENQNEFVLEKYLEDFIVSNFDKIFRGSLRIYRDADDTVGQQFDTPIGRIDILAIEPATNSMVVIELKKGRSSDHVVGQILRYMGWVEENLCKAGATVRGLVICRDHDQQLSYALRMTKDVSIRHYRMSFSLTEGS